jgi:hypothetical protein
MATLYFNGAVDGDWNTVAAFATGSVGFSNQPADGDTLTINSIVFEFDNDSSTTGGNVAVAIGVDLATTLSTLEGLVESNVSVGATINGTSLDLISNTAGSGSNYSISASSSVITTGNMSGGADGNWWSDDTFTTPATSLPTSSDSVVASATISSNSGSAPTVVNFTVNGNIYINIDLTVSGMATFNDASTMGQIVSGSKFINGNATFNNTSILLGTINGNATFNNSAICAINSNVSTNAEFNNSSIKRGNVTGTITWNSSYPSDGSLTYYFNGAQDGNWNRLWDIPGNNPGNWFLDSSFTIYATNVIGLPTNIDSVISSASITSNSGSQPTIVNFTTGGTYGMYITLTVSGTATFNDSSHNDGTLTGNATFNDTSSNAGTLTGQHNFIFNDSSYNDTLGTINYSAIFNDYSYNDGSVDPGSVNNPVIFNDNSYNNNSIVWAAIFNNSSYNVASITGNVIFNHNSYMEDSGSITGDAVFNNESSNRTNISGSVTLNPDRGINGSSILGLV